MPAAETVSTVARIWPARPTKLLTKSACGAIVNLGRTSRLFDLAPVHHHELAGERLRLLLVVRDDDRCDAKRVLETDELDLQVEAQRPVERGERLVEQQQRRIDGERSRDGDTLLLPSRKLLGEPPRQPRQLHGRQQLLDARLPALAIPTAEREGIGDVLRDGHMRKERVVLKHHADAALTAGERRNVFSIKRNDAGRYRQKARDGAQHSRLAAATGPEERCDLTRRHLEAYAFDRWLPCVGVGEPFDGEAQ